MSVVQMAQYVRRRKPSDEKVGNHGLRKPEDGLAKAVQDCRLLILE